MKIFELAKELDMGAIDLVEKLKTEGMSVRNHMSSLSDEELEKAREIFTPKVAKKAAKKKTKKKVVRKKVVKKAAAKENDSDFDSVHGYNNSDWYCCYSLYSYDSWNHCCYLTNYYDDYSYSYDNPTAAAAAYFDCGCWFFYAVDSSPRKLLLWEWNKTTMYLLQHWTTNPTGEFAPYYYNS